MEQDNQQNNGKEKFSKVLPTWQFILLTFVTFGIYELVWFYRNWKLLKEVGSLKISPFWRAFFAPFYAGSIAGQLQKFLKEKNSPCDYSPTIIGISYFIIMILWRLPDPFWLVSFLSFVPMLPLVNSMNTYWQKEEQGLPVEKFTWWQMILVVLGALLVIFAAIGAFMPA